MFYLTPVLFALAWVALSGSFSPANLLLGLLLGAGVLYLIRGDMGAIRNFGRIRGLVSLSVLFVRELIVSAWRVLLMVVKPDLDLKPGIFAYELQVERDFEITLLANLITLTPGTLSVDVSPDRRVLYVHAIDCSDPDQTRREIAEGFERRIMEAFR
jgi:multicomponent Na+:H+ antiporter subunit E